MKTLPSRDDTLRAIIATRQRRLSAPENSLERYRELVGETRLVVGFLLTHGGLADRPGHIRDLAIKTISADDMFLELLDRGEPVDGEFGIDRIDADRDGLLELLRCSADRDSSLELKLAFVQGEQAAGMGVAWPDAVPAATDFVSALAHVLETGVPPSETASSPPAFGEFAENAMDRLLEYAALYLPHAWIEPAADGLFDVRKAVRHGQGRLQGDDILAADSFVKSVEEPLRDIGLSLGGVRTNERGYDETGNLAKLTLETLTALLRSFNAQIQRESNKRGTGCLLPFLAGAGLTALALA